MIKPFECDACDKKLHRGARLYMVVYGMVDNDDGPEVLGAHTYLRAYCEDCEEVMHEAVKKAHTLLRERM